MRFKCLRKLALIMLVGWMPAVASAPAVWAAADEQAPGRTMARQAVKSAPLWITTDHSRHEILKKSFSSGPEVTEACLSCHNQASLQFHQTIHWTWRAGEDDLHGKGGLSVNNF